MDSQGTEEKFRYRQFSVLVGVIVLLFTRTMKIPFNKRFCYTHILLYFPYCKTINASLKKKNRHLYIFITLKYTYIKKYVKISVHLKAT